MSDLTCGVGELQVVHAEVGATVAESTEMLRRLSDLDAWTGTAAGRFAEAAEDVVGDLSAAERRHVDAGEALRPFVQPVIAARDDSLPARREAVRADARRLANAGSPIEGVALPTSAQTSRQEARERAHRDAVGDLERPQADLQVALVSFDRPRRPARRTCAQPPSTARTGAGTTSTAVCATSPTGPTSTEGDDAARAVSAPVQRKLQEEVARLQALPAPSPAVTEALDAAVRQIRVATVVGYGGDAGTLVNAADLAYPVVDRFDEWLALTEWRLSR